MKKILIFATGSKTGGGSGFEVFQEAIKKNVIQDAEVVAVVSNIENGGVRERAHRLGIPFVYFDGKDNTAEQYNRIASQCNADFVFFLGWLLKSSGLDPATTVNIHPSLLPKYGGKGMYGHHVHEAVFENNEKFSGCTIHFVTKEFDKGPMIAQIVINVSTAESPEEVGKRVNVQEHEWHPFYANLVIQRDIAWDGINPSSLRIPDSFA